MSSEVSRGLFNESQSGRAVELSMLLVTEIGKSKMV